MNPKPRVKARKEDEKRQVEVRTRFAPSPTGSIHIGGIRTALFNYYYARRQRGKFILRIEDTDQERNVKHSEAEIYATLRWLGLVADEAPRQTLPSSEGLEGPYGPYRQSERLRTYEQVTEKLLASRRAYPCFCSDATLKQKQLHAIKRGVAYVYDGQCRNLSDADVAQRKAEGQPFSIRFVATTNQQILVDDLVQGVVRFESSLIGDFIIVKSNGFPSYNFAVVVDDHDMKISHVIRGVGHLSNTPRQILLYEALGYPLPAFAHIAEIVGADKKKLSKRRGAIAVLDFRSLGYLPEALANYMALLGWSPKDGREVFAESIPQQFDIGDCSKSPAFLDIFHETPATAPARLSSSDKRVDILASNNASDTAEGIPQTLSAKPSLSEIDRQLASRSKLNYLNHQHMLRRSPTEIYDLWTKLATEGKNGLARLAEPALVAASMRKQIEVAIFYLLPHVHRLTDFSVALAEIFFPDFDNLAKKHLQLLNEGQTQKLLSLLSESIAKDLQRSDKQQESASPSVPEEIEKKIQRMIRESGKTLGLQGRSLYLPVRIAMTGKDQGLEIPLIFAALGQRESLQRLKRWLGAAKIS